MQSERESDVVIVGAGAAGLAAAERLGRCGLRVVLLEARSASGGRLMTLDVGSHRLELGAGGLHGSSGVHWDYVRRGGLRTRQVAERQPTIGFHAQLHHWLRGAQAAERPLVEGLEALGLQGETLDAVVDEYAGLGVDPTRLGVQEALSTHLRRMIDFDRDYLVLDGMDRLVATMVAGVRGDLVHEATVQSVRRSRHRVEVTAATPAGTVRVSAKRLVIAVPIGVLQQRRISFEPDLPAWKQAAIDAVLCADHVRFHLVLGDVAPKFPYTKRKRGRIGVWRASEHVIEVWGHGVGARELVDGGTDQAQRWAEEVVGGRLDVTAGAFHDFFADPNFGCAYSWTAAGRAGDRARLPVPVDDTLFFAGEAVARPEAQCTIHGAIETGIAAADAILAAEGVDLGPPAIGS